MATQIGIVKAIFGEATATAADGSIRTLQAGDKVFANELITTGPGGAIEIEFADGSVMDLGRNSQAMLDSEVFDPNATAVAEGAQEDVPDDVAAIQQALLEGEDPTEIGEATAAGAGVEGGNEGNNTAVFVDYLNPAVTPDAGFDTVGVTNEYDLPEEDIIILEEEDPLVEESTPSTTATSVFVDEDDLGGEFLFAFVGPSGIQSAFETDTGLFSQFPFVFGNNDEAIGDDLPTNSPTTVTGSLNADFGTDGAGSVQFNPATAQPAGLTSGGEPVQFWVSADGSMLVGYILTVPDYEYDAQEAQADFPQYAEIIFTAEIPDSGVTDFAFTLHGPLDQAIGGNENNLNIDLSYVISDSDGDTANGVLQINVDDDSPVIGEGQAPQPQLLRVNELQVEPRTTTVDEDDTENGVGNTDSPGDDPSFPFIALPISFGADGPAEENPVEISAEDIVDQYGNPLTSNGEQLTFEWNPDTNTLEGSAGGETVIELSVYVDPFGFYTEVYINLQGNLDHPIGAEGESLGTEDNLNITLNFTATDADGDQAEGEFSFRIDDDMPLVDVTVGEFSAPSLTTQDAQTIGLNSDTATGSFAAAFGLTQNMGADDGGTAATLQYSLSVGAGMEDTGLTSNDNDITLAMEGDDIVGTAGGETVFRISVDAEGMVTLTQYAEIDHLPEDIDEVNDNSNIGLPTGSIELTASAEIIDGDGDKAVDSETIDITGSFSFDDDLPTADDEAVQDVIEGQTISGQLDFTEGADGASVTEIDGNVLVFGLDGYSQSVSVENGSIKVKADGTYEFTADDNLAQPATSNITYTVVDGDNDSVTADIDFNITDANTPTASATAALVDDEGLSGGIPGGTGDAADANADADNDESTFTGTLNFSFGGDGAGTIDFAAMDSTQGSVGSETVDYSWSGNTLTATVAAGEDRAGTTLFTVEITNTTTGAYTVTLLDNVLHAEGLDENDATAALTFTVTDADNSTANGTLTVTFDDDTPTATDEASQDVAEGATVTGTLDFAEGADGASVTHINNETLVFDPLDEDYSQEIDLGDGVIKVKADGSYSYTADASVINPATDSATYTVTDSDGDTVTADIDFNITDANTPTASATAALVDDEGLSGGIPGGTGDAADANADADNDESTFTGTLNFSFGGDGAGTIDFAAMDSTQGSVGSETVDYSWSGNTLTATVAAGEDRAGTTLFTVEITNTTTGAYTVTLLDNVLHAEGLDENDATAALTFTVTDADSSTANGTLTVTFDDDTPGAINPTTAHIIDLATSPAVTEELNFAAGADGVDGVTFDVTYDGELAVDGNDNPLSFGGSPLYLFTIDDGMTIVASTAETSGAITPENTGYTVTLNGDGTYSFNSNGVIENGTSVSATDLSGVGGGNVNFKGLYGEIDSPEGDKFALANTDQDVMVSTALNNTVNSNANDIGVGNGNSLSVGEGIRFDLVNDLSVDTQNDTFSYTDHNLTNSYRQKINFTNQGDANFTLMAIVADSDDLFYRDSQVNPDNSTDEYNIVLNASNINVYDAAGDLLVQGVDYGINDTHAYSVTLSDIQAGWTYEIVTEGDDQQFSAVQLDTAAGSGNYKLGFFSYGSDSNGEPIDLSYDVTGTDGDGDSVGGSVDMVLYPAEATVEGTNAGETLNGTELTDYILAYDGDDTLFGDAGEDVLIGGKGNDTMDGGTEADTFIFSLAENSGDDIINNFEVGSDVLAFEDVIDANESTTIELGDAIESYDNGGAGADLTLNLTNGGSVTLTGAGTGAIDSNIDLATYLSTTVQSDQS
jgi:T1SS-143 domain-containing protein